ncbi:Energy-coupling factor transporter transmembrane protein EcfT [Methanosarcinaceae archaeon Ag5]|uniref:Energy-coupling factor transporter transmembrane protein EcfT n=1 Tax=Methanolapillus africanus TaxID=3028297 RepID=A0AAE4MLM8_9EURY|nr:Energy-coupling factor transporter transmembrane protein EcfT [Methanosarcinaceae archaeon Ag5]
MKLPSETYSAIDAPIQRMNPMTKVIVFLLLIFSVSIVKSTEAAAFILLLAILLWILAKLPVSYVLKRMAAPFLFVFIFAVALLFSTGSANGEEIVWSVWIFNITSAGISEAVLILIRATAALLLITILLGTTKFDLIVKVLYDLKVPIFILQILMFSYRYIFVFAKELDSMRNSMASKGFTPKISMRSMRAAANTVAMLFINGFERADAVYQSMVSKGYTGKPAIITKNKMYAKDYAIVVLGIVVAVAIQIPTIVSYLSAVGV